jgi:hypothetical protein
VLFFHSENCPSFQTYDISEKLLYDWEDIFYIHDENCIVPSRRYCNTLTLFKQRSQSQEVKRSPISHPQCSVSHNSVTTNQNAWNFDTL